MSSIFSKIIAGELPSYKIYEDDKTFAFLDIHPSVSGYVLVVPKVEVNHFMDLDNEHYHAMMETAKYLAQVLRRAYPEADRVGLQIEGIGVPHTHVKLFPFSTVEEYHAMADMDAPVDDAALKHDQERILAAL